MKSISVSNELHKWIMNHKDSERTSAEKVIWGVINRLPQENVVYNGDIFSD